MKKIGITLDSLYCNTILYDTIRDLANNNNIDLFFIIKKNEPTQNVLLSSMNLGISPNSIIKSIEYFFFNLLIKIEAFIFFIFSKEIKEYNITSNVYEFTDNEIVYLNPNKLNDELIVHNSIKSLDLDLIVLTNNSGYSTNDKINLSKDGTIFITFGKNCNYLRCPPAFWEVYLQDPSTLFTIEHKKRGNSKTHALFRGEIPTKVYYIKNFVSIEKNSYPHIVRIIIKYAITNNFLIAPSHSYVERKLSIPTFAQSFCYFIRFLVSQILSLIKNCFLYKHEIWHVAYSNTNWQNMTAHKRTKITPPRNHFYADPFLVEKAAQTICFLEDYNFNSGKACITAVEIIDDKNYKILGPVINEPFHMSFPFTFEYQNELYMVPETTEKKSIRLYKCVDFPLEWKYEGDLMNYISAADSIIFYFQGKWWLLFSTNIAGNDDHDSILMAYSNDNPLTNNWKEHELNPLICDSKIGRNGGLLEINAEAPIRVRQRHGYNFYGEGVTFAKIIDLTPNTFSEEEIKIINPKSLKWMIKGIHHMHSNKKYTVFDYTYRDRAFKKKLR